MWTEVGVPLMQEARNALLEEIDDTDILEEWGGQNRLPLYESPHERQLAAFVERLECRGGS
jgi:hypothetical protein